MPVDPDFRTVVLEYERHPEPVGKHHTHQIVHAVTLVDEPRGIVTHRLGQPVRSGLVHQQGIRFGQIAQTRIRAEQLDGDIVTHRRNDVRRKHLHAERLLRQFIDDAGSVRDRAARLQSENQVGAQVEYRAATIDSRLPFTLFESVQYRQEIRDTPSAHALRPDPGKEQPR